MKAAVATSDSRIIRFEGEDIEVEYCRDLDGRIEVVVISSSRTAVSLPFKEVVSIRVDA